MERTDLLYSGLMFAAEGMLLLWTAVLLTAAVLVLGPSARKSAPGAATIASTTLHGAEEPTSTRPLPEALPSRPLSGRSLHPADQRHFGAVSTRDSACG